MKFNVGDRVACYWEMDSLQRSTGRIFEIDEDGTLCVEMDEDEHFSPGSNSTWHPNQCRRVAKKHGRSLWATIDSNGSLTRCRLDDPQADVFKWDVPWIEFKEVKKKKV